MVHRLIWLFLISLICLSTRGLSQTSDEKVEVIARRNQLFNNAGSVDSVSAEKLKQSDHTDIERVLNLVPGVTMQGEDGYGLRPNIGIRGVAPHRSRKITLLEDDVPLAPAPYSAPAAYYFPSLDRKQGHWRTVANR